MSTETPGTHLLNAEEPAPQLLKGVSGASLAAYRQGTVVRTYVAANPNDPEALGLLTDPAVRLGLVGETGELAELFKKHLRDGVPLDHARIVEEAGDVMWYLVAMDLPGTGTVAGILKMVARGFAELEWQHFARVSPYNTIYDIAVSLVTAATMACQVSLHDILAANTAKLLRRYPPA